jgi:hypothetical protein
MIEGNRLEVHKTLLPNRDIRPVIRHERRLDEGPLADFPDKLTEQLHAPIGDIVD